MRESMKGIYYGAGRNVIGPYHEDEIRARAAAQHLMGQSRDQVYEIRANSYEDARRKLAAHYAKIGGKR